MMNPIFMVSGSSLAFPDKKKRKAKQSRTATPSSPDRRERTSLQNPGEASIEAACRDHQKSSGASWVQLETIWRQLETIWGQLGAAGGQTEAPGSHLGAKVADYPIIYYKSSHRPSNVSIFTCFRALGTPKSHVYPIIYISKSTF